MTRLSFLFLVVALVTLPCAAALDLPFSLGFQLGFTIRAVPAPDDQSAALGLYVESENIYSDKERILSINGTITNYGESVREDITMALAVSSYIGLGYSNARATIEPSTLAPGESAAFSATVFLQSEKPKNILYTINSQ